MTKKKMYGALMVGIICFILCAIPTIASAYVDLGVGQIVRVGVSTAFAGTFVEIVDVNGSKWAAGTKRQFFISEELGNQGLATLLTAYSMEKTVFIRISGDGSAGSLITTIYINKD